MLEIIGNGSASVLINIKISIILHKVILIAYYFYLFEIA